MRFVLFLTTVLAAAALLALPGERAHAQFQSTEPKLFFCYALNPSEGVVYVSDVHSVGPFEGRASYPDRFETWLRASGRLDEGKAHCLMRATMREVDRDRRDLPMTGCFECVGPQAYRDVKWPFGDEPVDSVRVGDIEPPRSAMSSAEQAALDRREAPETRPGTWVFGRIDQTDVVKRVGAVDCNAEEHALSEQKGGKWYAIVSDDRSSGWHAVAYASSPTSRRYFSAQGATELEAMANAKAKSDAYVGARELWKSEVITTYYNDTVEVDDRSLGDKAIDTIKDWVREQVVKPEPEPLRCSGGPGVRG